MFILQLVHFLQQFSHLKYWITFHCIHKLKIILSSGDVHRSYFHLFCIIKLAAMSILIDLMSFRTVPACLSPQMWPIIKVQSRDKQHQHPHQLGACEERRLSRLTLDHCIRIYTLKGDLIVCMWMKIWKAQIYFTSNCRCYCYYWCYSCQGCYVSL